MTEQLCDDELRHQAIQIADTIGEHRVETENGERGWVGFDSTEGVPALPKRKGIYSGQLGVALFYSGLFRSTGRASYATTADESASHILEGNSKQLVETNGFGAGSGIGSIIYSLTVMSELLGDSTYRKKAIELSSQITVERLREASKYDVLSGTAGTLLALSKLYEHTGKSDVLDRAIHCGEHLLENRYRKWGYGVWDTYWGDDSKSFSTGMGHGAAGIAYALYRLGSHTTSSKFRSVADATVQFENLFYSDVRSDWKSNWNTVPNYPQWWCYGLPGIGLARLGSLEYYESDMLRTDVERAGACIETDIGTRDSVCHGTCSRIALLIDLGWTGNSEYHDAARQLATKMVNRRNDTGSYRVEHGTLEGISNPAFFVGTAGIGYTLLRLINPELPTLLRFE